MKDKIKQTLQSYGLNSDMAVDELALMFSSGLEQARSGGVDEGYNMGIILSAEGEITDYDSEELYRREIKCEARDELLKELEEKIAFTPKTGQSHDFYFLNKTLAR